MVEKAPERRIGVDRLQALRLASDAIRKSKAIAHADPGSEAVKAYAQVRSLRAEAQGWLAHASSLKAEQTGDPKKEQWDQVANVSFQTATQLSVAGETTRSDPFLQTIAKYWLRRERAPYRSMTEPARGPVRLGETFLLTRPQGDPFFLDHQQAFWMAPANAQVPDVAKVQASLATRRNRGLKDYVDGLPPLFESTIQALRPDQSWLEVGIGEGHVIHQAFEGGLKAHVTGVDLGDLVNPERFKDRPFEFRKGDIHQLEFKEQFDVGTDYFTAASYAGAHLSDVVQREFDLIKPGGLMFFHITDGDEGAITQDELPDGRMVSLSHWLKSIPGIELVDERIRRQQPGHSQAVMAMGLAFRKVGKVEVPKLELVGHLHSAPPLRVYRQAAPDAPSAPSTGK